ncbi:hypothetical protein GIB67_027844 [Kingdonia uniflora]|uniref:non-specific serine/threonine protein kinase n=1 Tax=Kingdonia uniflora TaxID=39325 RepID=A0A7J7P4Y5_9MAGN|nr:hypothetical protein GIB67_027844 [Kingdonia uniflora]
MYKTQFGDLADGSNRGDYNENIETDPTGRYGRFKEVLGKGAMKTVYRAFDEVLGMEVAWNRVCLTDLFRSPDELQRLYSEVHLLSTLNNDSIIQFYTSWVDVDRRTFNFITELFTSGTLREYRQRYRRVDIRAVKNWARQILNGLVYLHCQDPPVIHRDLKCDNIFVNGHLGQVKIGDLGLAAILHGQQAHSVIGTPEFMAPELYEEEYNELVDIYSFGMCMLEMLTSEYPYSECTNPAQIYKKVTSGKLPAAFYRIQDLEAQRFVGKCLKNVKGRMSAAALLLDPFLASDRGGETCMPKIGCQKPVLLNNGGIVRERSPASLVDPTRSTNMKITGTMNLEDDTIYLKVRIADKHGHVKNISFPFDVASDTPIDVATEMVKELEITDKEPHEIAEVIEKEISALAPQWKEHEDQLNQSLSYQEEYEEDRSFYSFSSRSSQSSLSCLLPSLHGHFSTGDNSNYAHDLLLQDDLSDDDSCSQSSGFYSNVNYNSGNERENFVEPRREQQQNNLKTHQCTRFSPNENLNSSHRVGYNERKLWLDSQRTSSSNDSQLTRMRSMMDVRSQLLHRSLLEEMNKRRLFKTVGAVENIGFQAPCDIPSKKSSKNCKRAGLEM